MPNAINCQGEKQKFHRREASKQHFDGVMDGDANRRGPRPGHAPPDGCHAEGTMRRAPHRACVIPGKAVQPESSVRKAQTNPKRANIHKMSGLKSSKVE